MMKKIVSHPLFIGIISALIARFLPDVIGKHGEVMVKFLYTYLWIGVWPIWIGLFVAITYWFIRFFINIYKLKNQLKNFDEKISNIIGDINELKKWIGLFSYKDSYSDLKGKIKCYIKEELEKNTMSKK